MMKWTMMMVAVGLVMMAGVAIAQQEQAAAPVDIVIEGKNMAQAATEGNWEVAFGCAQRILDAASDDTQQYSAEELYWTGMAHMYLMAQWFQAAQNAGLEGEQAELAARMTRMVLNPYEDVRVVSHGQEIELTDYLVPGQTVIFDFFSEYCPPCMQIAPYMERLAEQRDDIVLVKVDINRPGVQGIDWSSPVARQYNLRSIPHFKIFGPDGEMQAEGDQARMMIMQWLQQSQG